MKQNTLGDLLEKYAEGTITSDQLDLLNQLTHKDETLAAADRRVRQVRRQRLSWGLSAGALLLVATGLLLRPTSASMQAPAEMVAAESTETIAPPESPTLAPTASAPAAEPVQIAKVQPRRVAAANTGSHMAKVEAPRGEEQIVVCNNSCDADSVIDEIWKFLSA